MSIDFRRLTSDLRMLIDRLKNRCLEAEAHVSDLQQQLQDLQAQGLAATGGNPEQVEQLKNLYLAMVSEIDACIETLQHG